MEEFDSHTEHAQDQAHEAAQESRESWITGVALTAAILAALAAVSSMLSGHHEHEAMIDQIRASDQWSFFQSTSIKLIVREQHIEDMEAAGQDVSQSLRKKVAESTAKKKEIQAKAEHLGESSEFHDRLHMTFGGAVTCFQVAIAVAAISALTRRRVYWFVGITLGLVAVGFLAMGLMRWRGGEPTDTGAKAESPAIAHAA